MLLKCLLSLVVLTSFLCADKNDMVCSDEQNIGALGVKYVSIGGMDTYILANTLRKKEKGIIEAWDVVLSTESFRNEMISEHGQEYHNFGYMKQLNLYDIVNKKYSIIAFAHYTCDGQLISSAERPAQLKYIIPGSVLERKMDIVENIARKK